MKSVNRLVTDFHVQVFTHNLSCKSFGTFSRIQSYEFILKIDANPESLRDSMAFQKLNKTT